MTTVAFIGLGNMGEPMARNLLAAGHEVAAFDLVDAVLERIAQAGGRAAANVADAVTDAEVVITMLPEGRHVREVYLGEGGVVGRAPTSALLVDCSTIDVATARAVAADAAEAGYTMLDAPVSGGVGGAEAATLTFMVGGPETAFERARPLLAAMGRNLVHAGGNGNGQATKICNNMMAAIAMIGVSEAFSLGEALGLDAKRLYDVMSTSSGQTWMLERLCPVPGVVESAPCNREFAAGFKAALMAKDLGLAQDAARDVGAGTPLGSVAAALYRLLCQQGRGDLDCSAVYRLVHGDVDRP